LELVSLILNGKDDYDGVPNICVNAKKPPHFEEETTGFSCKK
jgi:hypothetical protein